MSQKDSVALKTKNGVAWERPWDLKEQSGQERGTLQGQLVLVLELVCWR